jgi:uncharacterized protein
MSTSANVTPIRQILLKVHSRCNLSCTYCYVYHHVDQQWRNQPMTMSRDTVGLVATRIAEHARRHALPSVTVILHGGEPLLAGAELIDHIATTLVSTVPAGTAVRLHVQTNGVLIDEDFLQVFDKHNILVGVSLDGGPRANDRHRRYANGSGSYARVARGLAALRQDRYRHLYSGLLSTIDVRNDPLEVFDSLLAFAPPRIDFLLPHGNWTTLPPDYDPTDGRTPYADWLIPIFDAWYAGGSGTDIRVFRSIIELLGGGRSPSEALGLDPVDLLVIETDGSIEQGDALKTVADGASATGLALPTHTFDDALAHPGIRGRQLGRDALAEQCRRCPIVAVCGGGLYAHRYRADNGFANPTVFCRDQLKLIGHIRERVRSRVRERTLSAPIVSTVDRPDDYRFVDDQFDELAAGYGGKSALEVLRSAQASKRRLLLHAVLGAARGTGEWAEWGLADSWTLLDAATRNLGATPAARDAADEVLHHPFVDEWAARCARALRASPRGGAPVRAELAYLPALAAAVALRAGRAFDLTVPVPDGRLALPGLGLAEGLGSGVAKVSGDGDTLTIVGPDRTVTVPAPYTVDGECWYARRSVSADSLAGPLTVAIEDLDPNRACFRLPPAPRLSAAQLREFATAFDAAWQLIGAHHPEHALAMSVGLRAMVPLRAPRRGQVSAAARTAYGAIAVSVPEDGAELALLMIHEVQHMKLGSVLDIVDLYDPTDPSLHHAPWRADPRPVGALIQGLYAHLGVADYWRVRRSLVTGAQARAAEVEFTYWLEQNARAAATLAASGSLTVHGERFVHRLRETLETWRAEPVSPGAAWGAAELVRAGTVRWRLANLRPHPDEVSRLAQARRDGRPCPPVEAPVAGAAAPAAAALDGLAGHLRAALAGAGGAPAAGPDTPNAPDADAPDPPDAPDAAPNAAESAYLAGDYPAANALYRAAVAAAPHATEPWIGLALSALRAGAGVGARILNERPDLVRAVFLALDGHDRAPEEVAGWLAAGFDAARRAATFPG